MIDPQTLRDLVELITEGATVVCNAATRERFLAELRAAGAPETSIRFRVSAWQPDWHVTVIRLDGGDPLPYALTAEAKR